MNKNRLNKLFLLIILTISIVQNIFAEDNKVTTYDFEVEKARVELAKRMIKKENTIAQAIRQYRFDHFNTGTTADDYPTYEPLDYNTLEEKEVNRSLLDSYLLIDNTDLDINKARDRFWTVAGQKITAFLKPRKLGNKELLPAIHLRYLEHGIIFRKGTLARKVYEQRDVVMLSDGVSMPLRPYDDGAIGSDENNLNNDVQYIIPHVNEGEIMPCDLSITPIGTIGYYQVGNAFDDYIAVDDGNNGCKWMPIDDSSDITNNNNVPLDDLLIFYTMDNIDLNGTSEDKNLLINDAISPDETVARYDGDVDDTTVTEPGKIGDALKFCSSSQAIDVPPSIAPPHDRNYDEADYITISMWLKHKDSIQTGTIINFNDYSVYETSDGIGFGANEGFMYGVSSDYVFSTDGNYTNLLDGNWHHLVFIFKRNDIEGSTLYVDANLYPHSILAGTAPDNDSATFDNGIHFHPILSDDSTCNSLDHVRVYKRELSKEEIDALYIYDTTGLWSLNNDTNNIYTYTNVGIGTAWPAPGVKLDVNGRIQSNGINLSCMQGEVSGGLYCHTEVNTTSTDNSPHLFAKPGKSLMFSTDGRVEPDVQIYPNGQLHAKRGEEVTGFLRLTPMSDCINRDNCKDDNDVGRLCYYNDPYADLDDTYTSKVDTHWFDDRDAIRFEYNSNDVDPQSSDIVPNIHSQTINLDPNEKFEMKIDTTDDHVEFIAHNANGQEDKIKLKTQIDPRQLSWTEERKKREFRRWYTTNGFYGCTKRVDRYRNNDGEYELEVSYEWRRLDLIGKENHTLFTGVYDEYFEPGIQKIGIIAEDWACNNLMEGSTTNAKFVHQCTQLDSDNSAYRRACRDRVGQMVIARCNSTPYRLPATKYDIDSDELYPCSSSNTAYNHFCSATDVASGKYGCKNTGARMLCGCSNETGFAPCYEIEDIDYNYGQY